MKWIQKWTLPSGSFSLRPDHLREPVVGRGEDAEHRAAEEHVVEVGDHEVRVLHVEVDRRRAEHDPAEPPIRNIDTKPSANSIGVVSMSLPRHSVASQLNIFTPVGTAISAVMKRRTAGTPSRW